MILITGGAGFIGHGIVAQLNRMGRQDLIIADNIGSSSKWKNLVDKKIMRYLPREQLGTWLTEDPEASKLSAIIHMGACSHTSEQNMDYLTQHNFQASLMLYRECCRRQIPFLYASSAATYGNGEHGYKDDDTSFEKIVPINRYGLSKHWFDRWVLCQEQRPPFWCGFKFFNVFGPGEYHKGEMRSLVCKAVPQIQTSQQLKLFRSHRTGIADGQQLRDFIYIKDVVQVVVQTLLRAEAGDRRLQSGVYNVGTGKARSFYDLGAAVFNAMDVPLKIDWIDIPSAIREGYQYYTEADLTRLKNQLGYTDSFTSLEDAVTEYVQEYLLLERSL
ncbi:MAG: ADP-glyceromanno-heptose 6-epimerase [Zetaproteobacteria bacterium]|nr:ADP-glyceromanno-heptose 6-epimerase [Zetaproteobacteria bacterium]